MIEPINILFQALGVPALQTNIKGIAAAVGTVGTATDKAATQTEHLSDALDRIGRANSPWAAARNAKDLDAALTKVGANNGIAQAELKATHFADRMETAKAATQNLHDVLERVRNAGAALTATGAGGIALSRHFQQVAREGDAVSARLNDLLEQQGRLGDLSGIDSNINRIAAQGHLTDDDPVREAAVQMASDGVTTPDLTPLLEATVRQAQTIKKPIEEVGSAMAKAYAEGSLTRLRRMNILFSDQEIESVKAAKGISEAAGQVEFMRVVLAATERNAVALGAGLTEAQKAANDLARESDTAMTALGEGADMVSEKVNSVGASILSLINQAPAVEQFGGAVGYIGSYALTAVGGVITLGSQIVMTTLGLQAMGITGVQSLTAITVAGTPLLALFGTIVAGMAVLAGAAYVIYKYWKEMQTPTETVHDSRSSLQQHEDQQNAAAAQSQVTDAEADTSVSAKGKIQIYKAASRKLSDLGDADAARAMNEKASALALTAEGKIAVREGAFRKDSALDPEAKRYIDSINGLKDNSAALRTDVNMPKAEANPDDPTSTLKAMVENAQKQAGTPAAARTMPTGSAGDAEGDSAAPSIASTVPASSGSGISQTQLDALGDAARNEKNPAKKKALQDQLRQAQRANRDSKAAAAAQKQAAAANLKDRKFGAKADSVEVMQDAAAQEEELRAALDERKANAKNSLEEQVEAIRKQAKMHLIGKDAANDKIDKLKDAQEHLTAAWDAQTEAESDRLKAQAVIASATAMAATQSGAEAAATMRAAQARAGHFSKMADYATKRAERELQRSKDVGTANEFATGGMFANFAKRTGSFISRGGGMFNPNAGRGQTYTAIPTVKTDPLGGMTIKFGDIKIPQGGTDSALAGF